MPGPYCEIFREHSRPLEPVPTGEVPVLRRLAGIRAVLFDVYGTLFISGSGEVGTAGQEAGRPVPAPPRPLGEALHAMGIATSGSAEQGVECLYRLIEVSHARSRSAGIDYPEVDIVALWREVLAELAGRGLIEESGAPAAAPKRLAVVSEAPAHPSGPMPHLPECLEGLRQGGLLLGLVSNAQFYTPELFAALLGQSVEDLGFDRELQYYSYQHGRAKPGLDLHEMAARVLDRRGVKPAAVVFVGNDMLGDILPAFTVGFRTALFAGDVRSLRLHKGDSRLDGISPEIVLTRLSELEQCILSALD